MVPLLFCVTRTLGQGGGLLFPQGPSECPINTRPSALAMGTQAGRDWGTGLISPHHFSHHTAAENFGPYARESPSSFPPN